MRIIIDEVEVVKKQVGESINEYTKRKEKVKNMDCAISSIESKYVDMSEKVNGVVQCTTS